LWDPRRPEPVYRFDQFTDYGGGGFHPAGNEVFEILHLSEHYNYLIDRSYIELN
jgi:HIV-1 Vpr-binding protein